jgi:hypothetical protein
MTLLLDAWRWPSLLLRYTPSQHDLLLRQAASAQLVALLGARVARAGVDMHLPAPVRRQFEWAARHGRHHAQAVQWEVRQIRQALIGVDTPLLLLKGAAYAMAALPAADGRLFADIDILVPRARLPDVEAALMLHGWADCGQDAYDQSYYRRWMHELPPMRHVRRATVIDVHHDIVPPGARMHDRGAALRAGADTLIGADPLNGWPALQVLAPPDMVLHSATHLLADSEFGTGLRNLADLDNLLAGFGTDDAFWHRLAQRAHELDLVAPLSSALHAARRLLGTALPDDFLSSLKPARSTLLRGRAMDLLLAQALLPAHASCITPAHRLARQLLFVRATWLRMPPWPLARHLCHKAFITPWQRMRPANK